MIISYNLNGNVVPEINDMEIINPLRIGLLDIRNPANPYNIHHQDHHHRMPDQKLQMLQDPIITRTNLILGLLDPTPKV